MLRGAPHFRHEITTEQPDERQLLTPFGVWGREEARRRSFSNRWKGKSMRMITILAAGVTLAFAATANAQEAPAAQPPAQAPSTAPEAPGAAQTQIRSVNIIDMTELPEATQTQVNEVVAQGGEASLQQLRTTIDANPDIKSALEAKGLTSAHVIAASMGPEGALTLVTKKAS